MPLLIPPKSLSSGYLINDDYKKLSFEEIEYKDLDSNLKLMFSEDSKYKYFRLDNLEGQKLSLIRLKPIEINNKKFYTIDKSKSFIQGKGYAIYLYEYVFVNMVLPVISDKTQTKPGSSNLWKKFLKRQKEKNYEIFVFNTTTNKISPYSTRNFNDYRIWGWFEDFTDMAKQDPKFLDDALKYNDISKELYTFLNSNIKKVKDRSNILLFAQQKNYS